MIKVTGQSSRSQKKIIAVRYAVFYGDHGLTVRLTRPVRRGRSASSRPSSTCRSVTHHGPPTRSSIGVASASLPPCCIVCSVVAYGSLSPSVTLYTNLFCYRHSFIYSTYMFIYSIVQHVLHQFLLCFTSQHANPHRPRHPIIS